MQRFGRKLLLVSTFAALVGGTLVGSDPVFADNIDAAENLLKGSRRSGADRDTGTTSDALRERNDEIRTQKEEAAESLNRQLREQREDAKAQALESGRAIIIGE